MSYKNLVLLQDAAQFAFALSLLIGAIVLVVGLFRPKWLGMTKRRRAVLAALCTWFVGAALYAGAIGYTHSQPNGPHSFISYMDGMQAQTCIKDPQHSGCAALRAKCSTGDSTHPSCRILVGDDPEKFYRP